MGGKQKQRTKGNTRPSSSGRAAELLERSSQGMGFIGFGSMSGDLGYVPTAAGADDFDSCLDSDIRLVLRKLTKRDAITKLKAMQELASLCKEKDEESVSCILAHWPRLYGKLALDFDRRVREATQYAFEQICLKVGRKLAPHLRPLMGTWIVSQCDTYAPASSAARSAFQKAFSPAKQKEAMAYCKTEVMEHLQDNLFNQTPTTLSDSKSTPVEEMDEKYTRNLTSSLLALKELLSILTPEESAKIYENFENILMNNKFWKFVKHPKPVIRSAFYTVVGAYCEHIPDILGIYLMRTSVNVLGNLDESDPTIVSELWHAVLLVITTYLTCWSHVNMRKAVLPKLWVLLKTGGKGSATVIYPNLLPLLSQLPAATFGQGIGFFQEYFGNMKTGLMLESVRRSSCETSAIIQALMECLRYCLLQNLGDTENNVAIQDYLVNEQLMPLLEYSMTENTRLALTSLYAQTSSLIDRLHKSSEEANINDSCERILTLFWEKFADICLQQINSEEPSLKNLENISRVLSQIHSPVEKQSSVKRKIRVTFSDVESSCRFSSDAIIGDKLTEKQETFETKIEEANPVNETHELVAKVEDDQMSNLVAKLCLSSYNLAKEKNSTQHCFFFSKMLSEFSSTSLFKALLPLVPCEVDDSRNYAFQFLDHAILPWINESLSAADKRILCQNLVDCLFSVMKLCSHDEQKLLLNTLCCQKESVLPLYLTVKKVISGNYVQLQSWTRNHEFGEKLISIAASLCRENVVAENRDEVNDSWGLLSLGLSTNKNQELVLGDLYIGRILTVMSKPLQDAINAPSAVLCEPLQDTVNNPSAAQYNSVQNSVSDTIAVPPSLSFICDVVLHFFKSSKKSLLVPASEVLLLALFQISCQKASEISVDLLEKLQETWLYGISLLVENGQEFPHTDTFLHKLAEWIKMMLMQPAILLDRSITIANAASLIHQVINENLKQGPEDEEQQITGGDFLRLILPTRDEWIDCRRGLPLQWKDVLTMQGSLMIRSDTIKLPETFQDIVPNQIILSVFLATLLTIQPQPEEEEENPDAEGNEDPDAEGNEATATGEQSPKSSLPWQYEKTEDFLLEVIYAMQWGMAVSNGEELDDEQVDLPGYLKQSSLILIVATNTVWPVLTCDQWNSLMEKAFERSMECGELWPMTLKFLIEKFKEYLEGQELKVTQALKTDRFDVLTEELIETLQVLIPHLDQDDVSIILEIQTAKLLTSPKETMTEMHGCLGALSVIRTCLSYLENIMMSSHLMTSILDEISQWKDSIEDIFLFSRKVEDVSSKVLFTNVEVLRFISLFVKSLPSSVPEHAWDFILCSLVEWIQSVSESLAGRSYSLKLKVQVYSAEVSNLLHIISSLLGDEKAAKDAFISSNLILEWKEFFSTGTFSVILPLYFKVTDTLEKKAISVSDHIMLQSLCRATCSVPTELLKQVQLKPKLRPGCNIPDDLQTIINHLMGTLRSAVRPVQLAAYQLLAKLMPLIPEYDKGMLAVAQADEAGETNLPLPDMLKETIHSTTTYLETILEDVPVGECMTVESGTEVYQNTMTYLLAWRLALIFFKAAPVELRAQYANFFRQSGLVDSLLINLFRLMPIVPTTSGKEAKSPYKGVQPSMFTEEPALEIKGCRSNPLEPQHLACTVYYNTLEDLPAMVRQWWNSQNKRIMEYIDRFTTKFASPVLCAKEIQGVQNTTTKMNNMSIKARPKTREVIATYRMDDMSMDLVIKLAINHPLGVIVVDSGKRVGVSTAQWRNWMLQMTTFLVHQNGTIVDGLKVWKSNIDKRFEGTDDCMICYSVIHGSNYSLPQLTCKTCKKKFHSACLYKWFNTSNQSSCPLCRNLF
ncbi:E3 ubiquitin-protein ligase listerin-like [Anneissia japonica]|uniref:E3 ubiquitin-protein ligase listerin-like n=1 Tax=Anneissia japonica TaxID=1529436 RepID=UPI001425B530|nr:E3 ubiquitin-protein ligase listerin-like [Anneissia japonica]